MAGQNKSNQTTLCKKCTQCTSNSAVCIVCEGFCSNVFHPKCAGLSVDEILCYRKLPNVLWMCDDCNEEIRNIRTNRTSQRSEIIAFPANATSDVDRHEKDIADLKKQIAAINQTLTNVTMCTASRQETTNGSIPLARSSPLSDSNLLCGSRSVGDPNTSNDDSGAALGDKYWLFFTRVKNTTTEREINEMVAESLATDGSTVEVKKLISPWRDASSLPYVSFKVGIDVRLKMKALKQSTWPEGICYREFRDNVWEPAAQRRRMI